MSTISPTRLNDLEMAANFKALAQDNFEVLAEEVGRRTPTYQSGVQTTILGPPTSGARVQDELWRDVNCAEYRCTTPGTPGTWRQTRPAVVAANPGSPITGYWIVRTDLNYAAYYWDGAAWQAVIPAVLAGSVVYQGTWAANTNTPAIPASAAGNKGHYYVVTGSCASGHGYTNVPAVDFQAGDWIISNGTAWEKVDCSDLVSSVAGQTGAVVLDTGDITDMTAAGIALATAADAAAQRTALGLGTIATQAASAVAITGGSVEGLTALSILDTGADHSLSFLAGTNLSANRTLTFTTGDANRTLTLSGDATITGSNTGDQTITLTGDVTGTGTGSFGATIANDAVTNGQLANMATTTIKGRVTGGTGDPEDLTAAQARTVMGITFLESIWIDAGAMVATTTSGAATATTESTTNDVMNDLFDFDASSIEYVNFRIRMPDEWDASTIKVKFHWTAASGSGAVVWACKILATRDDSAIDTAWGTAQTVTDTLIAALDVHISSATAAITASNSPAAGDLLYFQIYRVATDGGDTLAVDARLMGVEIQIGKTQQGSTAW